MGNLYVPRGIHELVREQHELMLEDASQGEHIAEWEALEELLHPQVRDQLELEQTQ